MSSHGDPEFAHWLDEARGGDGATWGRLLERYHNYLTLLARVQIGRQLQGKADAADLVQETFLEAHRKLALFRGTTEPEFVGWLRQILGTCLTALIRRYRRAKGRDIRLERRLAEELDQSSRLLDRGLVARQSSPSERAARREQAVLLADALERLPADYRDAIVLRHLEGLSFPEVARRMGRSVDSVEKLWVRALDRLRRALGESG
jgi:RNA polymerase sigma-70 factor (ECF subfamily)